MPGRAAALTRLTLPRLHAVRRRERLFEVVKERCRWSGSPVTAVTVFLALVVKGDFEYGSTPFSNRSGRQSE